MEQTTTIKILITSQVLHNNHESILTKGTLRISYDGFLSNF